VATGGNSESLADLTSAQADSDGVAMMPVADLESAIELLARLSYKERVEKLGLREDRADVILPAAMVYHHLARLSGAETIHVPRVGVKEGILLDLVDDVTGHATHAVRQEEILLKAAISLGRRFMFDEAHGLHVAVLARTLFDSLRDIHGMDDGDRRLLTAAAVLHDIGQFVSHKGHHKHSLYVLSRSELPGLSPREMLMVANVARYHRKNPPREQHGKFAQLSEEEQERVMKLAALLRVADALDRTHIQDVEGVEVSVDGKRVELTLVGSGDFLLERWTLTRKGALFEKIFGMEVVASS
jgi:exopolyphosphatase/guanosine-5'-triphosphate,3'-diphosphate pyrophosphatase